MKNYILHIGLPKTGTTAIQKHYFRKLKHPSVCYNPSSIIDPLIEALKLLDFGLLEEREMRLLNDVIKYESERISERNILISLELLSQRLLKFNFAARGKFLNTLFPNATVACVLRYQPVLLRSLYQQHISQNYLLLPEEVFVPFTKHVFLESERWKACMQIDIKEWNYTEFIQRFRDYYGDNFHVLFFENYAKNILGIGKSILEFGGVHVEDETLDRSIPKSNVSYKMTTMNIIQTLIRYKLAFHENSGFDSRHLYDLMEQADQAKYILDADSIEGCQNRLANRRSASPAIRSGLDKQILRLIKRYDRAVHRFKPQKYELPKAIGAYLESESKMLNTSLAEVVDKQLIPRRYL